MQTVRYNKVSTLHLSSIEYYGHDAICTGHAQILRARCMAVTVNDFRPLNDKLFVGLADVGIIDNMRFSVIPAGFIRKFQ